MTVIINARIYTGEQTIEDGFIRFERTIEAIGPMSVFEEMAGEETIDAHHQSLIPGMIDVHIHGGYDVDVMDGDAKSLRHFSQQMLQEGVTSFLATTITQDWENITQALETVREVVAQDDTTIVGVHLEGPFINPDYAGAQPHEHIVEPDVEQFLKWRQASGNTIKLVTYAPEASGSTCVRGSSAIDRCDSVSRTYGRDVRTKSSLHVTHGTHLYNQMRALHHREPGTVGYCLLTPDVYAEIIPDGIHSAPKMVDFAYRMKGADRLIVITDAMRAKGLADGEYELGGQAVFVRDGARRLENGSLAGSVLTMDAALRNIIAYTGCSLEEAVRMTSVNAAKELQLNQKGSLAVGKDADIVLLDEALQIKETIHRGTRHRITNGKGSTS
ncbi:N-acetylglucosamine-6-phosphate deacetylase [Exiguobacterium sp. SL14]|nr:N-acetylglucosamine-6-phosphate deacetylase [Exiguobacterium sp. SL14]MCY1692271.1 N-acetylglucosamine-6-phosphate deacetylase [Exiguobacterium sp. SL14]